MGGRGRELSDDGGALAIRTDVKGKGLVSDHVGAKGAGVEVPTGFSRTSSLNSLATSADEQVHTHLSASSAGDTFSSENSAHSTARTSAMTDDDRPQASSLAGFTPYAHPAVTVLELTANAASSSALPDSFGFNVSRKGSFVAVYTAANIWLIKAGQLPRLWARTLEVKRKPIAIDILEDGFLLAVLSRSSQVDLYEIHGEQHRQIKKRRTIMLVHEAHSMAISPDGLILITGNKFGIEVVAIGPDSAESCRRTLSGPIGDTLEFSDDGRTLLITGYARKNGSSSIFVLPGLFDGPLNEEGEPIPTSPDTAWTGLVLFPETSRIARQATLLPDQDTGHVNELFAFNADEDTWGIYDIAAQRFTQRKMFLPDQQRWTRSEFLDDAIPAVSPDADLAAVALRMRGTTSIWIYQVPEWDFKPKSQSPEQSPIQPCFCIPILHESVDTNQEISVLRWVKLNSNTQRLIAVGNISSIISDSECPNVPEGSKSMVIVLDFDKTKPAGGPAPLPTKTEYDLDPLLPGEKLPEGSIDFEREVELVRTRTLAQRRAQERETGSRRNSRNGSTPGRSRTTANRERPTSIRPAIPTITRDDSEELTLEEAQAAFEVPYDNTQPRSQNSLARAATVAAVSPANRRHLRALPFRPLEYRRADGLREFPHESDADNWVPPPPAYTATAEAAQSVSLSHPNTAPGPTRLGSGPRSSSGIPAVPPLPASMMRSRPATSTASPSQINHNNPRQRQGSFQSVSSSDLTLAAPQSHLSLVHPSTYPSPQADTSSRRRSSAAQRPLNQMPPPQTRALSAYQATVATRRPNLQGRRVVESTVELRPPPLIDPNSGRRGSAPDTIVHRRPVPVPASANRGSMPNGPPQRHSVRQSMLPRLSTVTNSAPKLGPLSAPPRANTGQPRVQPRQETRPQTRPDTRTSTREKSKKKIGCIVM